jgi:hypothetical protein
MIGAAFRDRFSVERRGCTPHTYYTHRHTLAFILGHAQQRNTTKRTEDRLKVKNNKKKKPPPFTSQQHTRARSRTTQLAPPECARKEKERDYERKEEQGKEDREREFVKEKRG